MTLWWPDFEDVHDWLVDQGYPIRDWGLLNAALERPLTTIAGVDAYPDIWFKTAAMLDSIERSHPFIDGNKRVGYLLVALVLRGNSIDDSTVSDDEWYDLIMTVASTHLEVPEIATRLRDLFSPID
ncbi:MAG: Fic family protein [Acidipropionibacterium sp.]|jgi:death-on-curing protein|nr:Fic family protein [Acidipropionibacterium sp.]